MSRLSSLRAATIGVLRDVRRLWFPCLLAAVICLTLAGLTQLQEAVRAVIFDFASFLGPVCITLVALLLLVGALHRLCAAAQGAGDANPTLLALIASSPVAATAVAIFLAASAIAGTRFLTQQHVAFYAVGAMLLLFVALVVALPSTAARSAWLFAAVPWVAAALAGAALLLPFAPAPMIVAIAQTAGPLGLVILFFFVICAVSTFVMRRSPVTRRCLLIGSVLAAVAFGQLNLNANHAIRTMEPSPARPDPDLKRLFAAWYNSRKDRAPFTQYPVYIVATAGGGYYAAYHAARVLARLQDQCANFAQHVFAISGVSGGSLGAGVFSALIDRAGPEQVSQACNESETVTARYGDAVEAYFKNDFLSPILLYALGADLVQRFLPIPISSYDRALGLEHAIERAWSDAERSLAIPSGANPLQAAFRQRWRMGGASPALMLNTTRVDTGQRVVFSPFRLLTTTPIWSEAAQTPWQLGFKRDLPTSTAIGLSARFPIVSPAGDFEGEELDWSLVSHQHRISLVDGGYFENSGTATAMDLFTVLDAAITEYKLPVSLRLIVIGGIEGVFDDFLNRMIYGMTARGDLKTESDDYRKLVKALRAHVPRSLDTPPVSGELTSPISTLLGTRTDQGKQAIHRGWLTLMARSLGSSSTSNVDDLVPLFGLSEANVPFPLSWIVSRPVRERIGLRTSSTQCVEEPFGDLFAQQRRGTLANEPRVKLLSEYGEDLRFIVELTRAACGLVTIQRALAGASEPEPPAEEEAR